MGYIVKKKKPYDITGSDGTVYYIPPRERLSVDDIALVAKYDKEEDVSQKVAICKEFILQYAPGLKNDPEIGDNEYALIFANYLNTFLTDDKTGES